MIKNIHAQRILIIDFGSQYSQLIARRVRECGVYCEIISCHTAAEMIRDFKPAGIILSGGPETVLADDTLRAPEIVFELSCPVLGICYGMQTMALQLGGEVSSDLHNESGHAQLHIVKNNLLLCDINDYLTDDNVACLDIWMSHGDQVVSVPNGFEIIASTVNSKIAAMANEQKRFYGVQFHPEVTHTKQGKQIFSYFVNDICGCEKVWQANNIITEYIENIRQQVGQDKVILGLSGGVDSLVAAMLLHKAIGNQLICIYVDHGLQRSHEAAFLDDTQISNIGLQVIQVQAAERFLSALTGITEPEHKRKLIGKLFIEVFVEQAQQIADVKWLAQGTIYSDVIESAHSGKQTHTIKSHHNVGGLPEKLALPLLEPIRELFKDEVRLLGLALGLSHDHVYRHPFPGPGLAVRIIGEVTAQALMILRQADAIFLDELHQQQLYHKVAQAFCVFLPLKSVGVVGDARQYGYVIALRAVESIDYMTANSAALPFEFLQQVSQRIVNEVSDISRVVYDVTNKPPATIEWE